MRDFDLSDVQGSSIGLDAFLGENPEVVGSVPIERRVAARAKLAGRVKIATLDQLRGFVRTAEDTLVHTSDRDLWALRKDAGGDFYIERMFDETGAPLKG